MSLGDSADMELGLDTISPQSPRANQGNRGQKGSLIWNADKREGLMPNEKRSRKVFVNPLFDPDPGIGRPLPQHRAMASAGDGVIKGEPVRFLPTRSCLVAARW